MEVVNSIRDIGDLLIGTYINTRKFYNIPIIYQYLRNTLFKTFKQRLIDRKSIKKGLFIIMSAAFIVLTIIRGLGFV